MKYSIEDSTLKRIANSIRAKKGTTDKIKAEDFANEIGDIPAPVPPNLQDKSIEITENGTTSVSADEGFDGLNNVKIVTSVSGSDNEYNSTFDGSLVTSNIVTSNTSKILNSLITEVNFKGENIGTDWQSMAYMFSGCKNVEKINLKNFNTKDVKYMQYMFSGCNKLKEVDLSSFNTESLIAMDHMFEQCKELVNLDLSSFTTTNVTTFFNMFYGCSKIENINLRSFDVSNVTNMGYMFYNCTSLKELDLSSFNNYNNNTVSTTYMFYGCNKLGKINLSNFDATKVSNYKNMFDYVPKTCEIITNQTTADWINNNFSGFKNITIVN